MENIGKSGAHLLQQSYDATIIGSGPNGLAAAIALAGWGKSVVVLERASTVGGGARSAELTLPGFVHDVCSAVHPLTAASPFLRTLPLAEHGLQWIDPPLALAHPFDDGTAATLQRSVEASAESLGVDMQAYAGLLAPFVNQAQELLIDILGPLKPPHHPLLMARFGLHAFRSAAGLTTSRFRGERARALFGGLGAHSMLPLERAPSAATGIVLAILAHSVGWPLPRGGAQAISDAMAATLRALGGDIVLDHDVRSLDDLPESRTALFDVTPRQLLRITGSRMPESYRRQLARYRYGPGVFKIDWALDGPIPWRAAECQRAGTVHLGGTLPEIARSERDVWHGRHAERPFVLLAQPSLFDATRAPEGKHVAWAYCHVPSGSTVDMTARIEAQVERFAPGFAELILARSTRTAVEVERENPNYIGGDINGGVLDLRQLFTRPVPRLNPYATPDRSIYLCSSSTPPGGGVHGMCGYYAARAARKSAFG
jgi:phytoene dehydrogenase-like protein